jgi:proteasome component ECM29
VRELCARLEEVQGCFISLLSDPKSKHLSRESCCLGLAACRSLANTSAANVGDDMNTRLLRAFGQTTVHGGSAMQETPAQAAERRRLDGNENVGNTEADVTMTNAEVGGASGIGEASLGAYREMAGAAMALGRPDILYALLMLSVSNPAWSAEGRDYGSSALLGQQSFLGNRSNAAEMRTALKGHLGKLIPRILRGCHSPNKETRAQMMNLWNGLTGGGAEARSAITQHLLVTVDTLIEDTTSKLWRTRLGACGALAQVLVGRSWIELGGGPAVLFDDDVISKTTTEVTTAGVRLLRTWRVAMRSLDDVRVNVREAGEALGRGVRSLTLRLVDPNALKEEDSTSEDNTAHEKNASAAAATALRYLIKHGLKQTCPEAAGVCVSCLVGIVDVAKPAILQPLVPDLLRSLLLSMSSLEPAAFNYLQVRAAGQDRGSGESYDTLERLRIQVVQSGPMATAVTKCLDMMPHMDLKIQKAVVPELDSAIRLSAGLTTRTAAADCVSTLCATCPHAFKFSGPSSTNPSVSLLRALYSASERERGQAAKDKYAHACGNLAALCPGSSVRSLALRAAEKYNSSTGSNDDPAARKAAAITLRAIAVKASNQFSDGGNSDVWCRRVLPVAFLGMRDPDPKVASLFADVWEEGGSAANLSGAADGFGNLLEEKLILFLVKECVKALNDVSWSRRVTGAVALQELATKEILSPAPRRLNGGTRDGVLEESVRAQRRAQASNMALVALVRTIADTRLWSGKQHVVESCSAIASKWSSALANTKDASAVLGVGSETSISGTCAPLLLTTASDADDLFVNDRRFKEEVEKDLPEEATQYAEMDMDVDEDPNAQDPLDFEDDGLGDEKAEASGTELSTEEMDTTDVKELIPTFIGLCRLFLVQAFPSTRSVLSVKEEEVLPYRAAVLKMLTQLLGSIDVSSHGIEQKKIAFDFVASRLTPLFEKVEDEEESKEESPLIVSRAIDCFAACFWEDFGDQTQMDESSSSSSAVTEKYSNILELSKSFQRCSAVERPWTIKTSSLNACARLVSKAAPSSLRDYATVSAVVECAALALKDRKFWKVR